MTKHFDKDTLEVYRSQIEAASAHFDGRSIAIWGTREKGACVKELLEEMGHTCSFFISSRPKTDTCCGLPLYTPDVLDTSKHYVLATPSASEVAQFLENWGGDEETGLHYTRVRYCYYSCHQMEQFYVQLSGRVDAESNQINYCCQPRLQGRPANKYAKTPEETVRRFISYRNEWINESRHFSEEFSPVERQFTAICTGCNCYQKKEWFSERLIHVVSLSMYPSPCQCRCFYCIAKEQTQWIESEEVRLGYETLFTTLEYAASSGFVSPDVLWLIICGEITIHPYRERILNLVGNGEARFFTNCFIYDEQIAQNLHNNPRSRILLSMDAGTAETWYKVKGVNNFEKVKENLFKYRAMTTGIGIDLKYIVFPGINDSDGDYRGLVALMKELDIDKLDVSCDQRDLGDDNRGKLIRSAARLFAHCQKDNICAYIDQGVWLYTPEEYEEIQMQAQALLAEGKV